MGHLRAAHTARLRQLSPHPLTSVPFSCFPPNPGASPSACSAHRGGGGQPRPSRRATRGVGQGRLSPRPGAVPSPTSSAALGGGCLRYGWGAVKDVGGAEACVSAAALSIACRSNSLLQREGLCLILCGWRKVVEEKPEVFLPASGMLFP